MTDRNRETRSLGEAKAHFAECVRSVEKGEEIVLTRHGRPVARLVPYETPGRTGSIPVAGRRGASSEVREPLADYEERGHDPGHQAEARRAELQRLLEEEIWPQIPEEMIGRGPSKREREQILGLVEDDT
jgi:prevent-host-death family protein